MKTAETRVPTPHIQARLGDFAETVLMPGDPLRAKYIAENYLENVEQITAVRNMLGFTGTYQGRRVSTMGSGMGIPSFSIYAYELYAFYGVENIIRIGSAGGLQDDIQLGDVIVAMGASTDSNVNRKRFMDYDFAAIANYHLLEIAVDKGRELKIPLHIGNVISADLFYDPRGTDLLEQYRKMQILGVEMEGAALYGLAAELGKKALCLLSVSDHVFSGESMSSEARQNSFTDMMELSLQTAIAI